MSHQRLDSPLFLSSQLPAPLSSTLLTQRVGKLCPLALLSRTRMQGTEVESLEGWEEGCCLVFPSVGGRLNPSGRGRPGGP
jgi:hypothetical protein